jgi:hypothetical protein
MRAEACLSREKGPQYMVTLGYLVPRVPVNDARAEEPSVNRIIGVFEGPLVDLPYKGGLIRTFDEDVPD